MKIDSVIQKLTLEEKAALLQGWPTWTTYERSGLSIPSVFLSDGPHGLRKQSGAGDHLGLNDSVPATCFPTAAAMANSWDPALGEALGNALGQEAAASQVHVVLGPGMNMKRSPLCGRNFEYFSEDPYLAGKMGAAYIRGIQKSGVSACPKHFAVNSQELRRMSVDSVLDERTLREIYLTAFEIAVKESSPQAIMSSYNKINGTYANENSHLLKEILREEWGFDGFVVTDWGADNNHTEGVRAGSNLVMPAPGPDCAMELIRSLREGRISEEEIDQRVREFLMVAHGIAGSHREAPKPFDAEAHHALARRCAEGSIVLLENDGLLPLHKETRTAVIGDFARSPRYQGAGSSLVNPTKLENLLDALKNQGLTVTGFAQGYSRTDPMPQEALIQEAAGLAEAADAVLLCVGLDEIAESEGMDRLNLELSPGQQALMEAVCRANANVVLVLSGGAPFVLSEALPRRAVIHGYLSGQAGASAMAEAILGTVNPSGKLNETWPLQLEDTPACFCFPGKEKTAEYREGLYIGYRYYETAGVPVRYPFGYGLSYTAFRYSDLSLSRDAVSFTLENTGSRDGTEIAQIYIGCKDGRVFRPRRELKGFCKVFLKAGERRRVTVPLDDKAFRYFNVSTHSWEVETGTYTVSAASSAACMELTGKIRIQGTGAENPYPELPEYESGRIQRVSDASFRALLGHEIPDAFWSGDLTENDALCQMRYAKSPLARLLFRILSHLKDRAEKKGTPDLNILFIYNMTFRAACKMSGGKVSRKMVEDLLILVNGHFFRGTGRLIADFVRNQRDCRNFMKKLEDAQNGTR